MVTKGDSYDVREASGSKDVRNLGKPVELAGRYFKEGADEVTFLNITVRHFARHLAAEGWSPALAPFLSAGRSRPLRPRGCVRPGRLPRAGAA